MFKIDTNGVGFTVLHSFEITSGFPSYTNNEGFAPSGGLILSGNTLYGTASRGGTFGSGTVFTINTDGTGFTNLRTFTAESGPLFANSDGAVPSNGLLLLGNTLYGTAASGGSFGAGTVFAVNTNGTGFRVLYNFPLGSERSGGSEVSVSSGNTLYGTAKGGGSHDHGSVFKVNIDGTDFSNLYSFTPTSAGLNTNSDGDRPNAGLILSGSSLYGTAFDGGNLGAGTVFSVNTDGTGFTNLHSFPNPPSASDGSIPNAGVVLSVNTLYGATVGGGSANNGMIFSLSFPPQLTITPSGPNVILTWPTHFAGFDYTGFGLQTSSDLESSAVWTGNSAPQGVVDGQNAQTNRISGTRQFYRLVSPRP